MSESVASEHGHTDDPWVMYYVVRSGVPFSLERAMASAGAAAVECVERFGADERWRERPRKVALRADGNQGRRLRVKNFQNLFGRLLVGEIVSRSQRRCGQHQRQ